MHHSAQLYIEGSFNESCIAHKKKTSESTIFMSKVIYF